MSATWDFKEFYARKAAWSKETFGPAQTTAGVVAHMRKELDELAEAIVDSGDSDAVNEELADICLLAIDLSWRDGGAAADMGRGFDSFLSPHEAAEYIGLHLDSIDRGVMPSRAGAVVIWDIAYRALGCSPVPILEKFEELQTRTWPDWRTVPADQPIEHVREADPTEEMMKREFERAVNATPTVLIGEKPMPISRDAYEARLIAKCDRLSEEIVKLTAERDDAKAAISIVNAVIIERDALLLEEKDWRADNERLRLERDDVRKVLAAQPNETVTMAAQRVVDLSAARRADMDSLEGERNRVRVERDRIRHERDSLIAWSAPPDWKPLLQALGMDGGFPSFAALVERAGQLRDDSVSYCSLRGRLVGLIGGGYTFSDDEILDALADGLENPVNETTLDVEEVVTGLEEDIATLKAALHVATRGRS